MTRITLAVTGSIAAFKAADLTSNLIKEGFEVKILMTQAATQFITPLTLQVLSKQKVALSVMDEEKPDQVNHIAIAKATDIFLVAPASANTISGLATGAANDIVTTVALALLPEAYKVLAPAMNTQMYAHPLVQENLQKLKSIGYQCIEPEEGLLACGDLGRGALAEREKIVDFVKGLKVEK